MKSITSSTIRLLFILPLLSWAFVCNAAPTNQPLLQSGDITHLGSFTLPSGFDGAQVRGLALSADGTKLYVGQWPSSIGQVSIPSLGGTATQTISVRSVPGSTGLDCGGQSEELAGLYIYNNRLILSKRCYFVNDASVGNNYLSANVDLTSFSSMSRMLAKPTSIQYTNGWMGAIPSEWQALLGGDTFAGNSNMSILNQTSAGPTFYTFDPDDVGVTNPIPATPLMLYPYADNNSTHLLNINPTTVNEWWNRTDQQNAGMVFPSGTSSVLFFYRHGDSYCYGTEGSQCTDPCAPGEHGEHGYPYHRQIMAFDANDLLAVKNGTKAYHEVEPYEHWYAPDAGGSCDSYSYSSLAYDDSTRKIYVSYDQGCCSAKTIDVYLVAEGVTGPDTTPPIISNGSPTWALTSGTTQTTMKVTTNENATCKFSTFSGVDYASKESTFSSTGTTSHSTTITGLTDGNSYTRYVRCIDDTGNVSTSDYSVSWTVSSGGGRVVNVSNVPELQAAFSSEQDGDEIVIAAGTYDLTEQALVIDVDNMLIRGATGKRDDVVIRGDAMSAGANTLSVFYFPQGAYGQNTTIKDLSVGRVRYHAIMFNGNGAGEGSTIDNVRLFDAYEQLMKSTTGISGSNNITVKNSYFEYTAGIGPQYYIGGVDALGGEGWTIQHNEFHNIISPNTDYPNPAIHMWENTTFAGTLLIERNKIVNCDRGIGIWNGRGATTIRNNFISTDASGTYSDVGIDIRNTPNVKVYNNSIWIQSSYPNAVEIRDATTTGVLVQNNLVNKAVAKINSPSGIFSNNITDAQSSWFANVTTGDLHLTSSVASIADQGTPVTGLTDDFDGELRSVNIDIGADQQNHLVFPPPNVIIK